MLVTFGVASGTNDQTAPRAIPPEKNALRASNAIGFLRSGERSIANALNVQSRSFNSLTRLFRTAIRGMLTIKLARTVLTVAAVVTAVLLIPMDYQVSCNLELQPVSRRFIASPFSAPLEK